MQKRTLEDVVSSIKAAKRSNRGCSLLIGAGCSQTAGIPLAGEFVEIIRERFPAAYDRAKEKSYAHCMFELADGERRDLIAEYVDKSKINWAHMAIAQLILNDFVDRVLTLNFDPLVSRACALVGRFPAIYDFAASQTFKPEYVGNQQAVFHLHGQRSGFKLLHTQEEVSEHARTIGPLFDDANRGRVWIVVGYSGQSDPVVMHLSKVQSFSYNLYWVGYKDSPPAENVQQNLLLAEKRAYWINGYDADDFFVLIAQQLGCFPPTFIEKPLHHIEHVYDLLVPYNLPGQQRSTDVSTPGREMIRSCKAYLAGDRLVNVPGGESAEPKSDALPISAQDSHRWLAATVAFLAGNYQLVINLLEQAKDLSLPEQETLANSYVALGDKLSEEAERWNSPAADRALELAGQKYEAALLLKPDRYDALNDWGVVLGKQAERHSGVQADRLSELAAQKFEAALHIKPSMPESFMNWGNTLVAQARRHEGPEADRLFALAEQKYETALRIKPDMHAALSNWGIALAAQAPRQEVAEADRLLTLAGQKFEAALRVQPDRHEVLNQWGLVFLERARRQTQTESVPLLDLARQKFEATLRIKPDMHEALSNWGLVFYRQAMCQRGEEADRLLDLAGQKFEAALHIKSDMHEALYNWGLAICEQALRKQGNNAYLFELAEQKFEAALRVKPDNPELLSMWGLALGEQAKRQKGSEADRLFELAGQKFEAAFRIKPDIPNVLSNWGTILVEQAKQKQGPEAIRLFELAGEKFETSLRIRPDVPEVSNNWGQALVEQAKQKQGPEAIRLFELAGEKFETSLRIRPDMSGVINNWGASLLSRYHLILPEKRSQLLAFAEEKFSTVHRLSPNESAYNMACVCALKSCEDDCRKWLEKAQAAGTLPPSEHLLNDPDLTSVRNCIWFQQFLTPSQPSLIATAGP